MLLISAPRDSILINERVLRWIGYHHTTFWFYSGSAVDPHRLNINSLMSLQVKFGEKADYSTDSRAFLADYYHLNYDATQQNIRHKAEDHGNIVQPNHLHELNSARFGKTHPCWRPLIRLCCRTAWYGDRATQTVRTRDRPRTRTHTFIFSQSENPDASLLLRLPSARRPSRVQPGTGLYCRGGTGEGGGQGRGHTSDTELLQSRKI